VITGFLPHNFLHIAANIRPSKQQNDFLSLRKTCWNNALTAEADLQMVIALKVPLKTALLAQFLKICMHGVCWK
jgi:hypothetical protein